MALASVLKRVSFIGIEVSSLLFSVERSITRAEFVSVANRILS